MCELGQDFMPAISIDDVVWKNRIASLGCCKCKEGSAATFVVKSFDKEKNKSKMDIYVNYSNDLKTVQMTRNSLGGVCFQPSLICNLVPETEDQLLFLKNGQVFSLPLIGGEAFQVTSLPLDVASFRVVKDSRKNLTLVVGMEIYCGMTPAQTKEHDEKLKAPTESSGMVFDKLMVRHWDNWGTYTKRNHLFQCQLTITPSGLLQQVGDVVDLMQGLETDCPGKAVGQGEEEYAISPDGAWIAMAYRKVCPSGTQALDMAWSTDVGIHIRELRSLEEQQSPPATHTLISGEDWHGCNSHPTFSADGAKLAFLSMARAGYESDKNEVRIFDVATRGVVSLTTSIDLSFSNVEWDVEGCHVLYATAQFRGVNRVFRLIVDYLDGGVPTLKSLETMAGDESRSSPQVVYYRSPSGSSHVSRALYYLETTLTSPSELKLAVIRENDTSLFIPFAQISGAIPAAGEYPLLKTNSHDCIPIYNPCPEFQNGDVTVPIITSHYCVGANDDLVHLWYVPPMNRDVKVAADRSIPLVAIIHGGPQGAILNAWNVRWNTAYYATLGYGVVAMNFHGSTGFGQSFTDSIRKDWGGKPYVDVHAAVDYVLQKYSYLDPARMAAMGASYGGYMVNWINGHSDRFKCLVNHDGVFSLKSLYFSTEELYFPEWEVGLPWKDCDLYHQMSPDTYVDAWKTPTLVIHGGKDYRIGESEGLSTFTALQRQGVPSRLLYFPDENHWVLRPANSAKWHQTVTAWLRTWLDNDGVAATTNG